MALDESHTRHSDRCESHPSKAAVAGCAKCGRALCIVCAIPVRGRVLGPECVEVETGIVAADRPEEDRPVREVRLAVGIGFLVVLVSITLPWSHYGLGSGAFGGWGSTLRWATLTVAAGILGCAFWVLVDARGKRGNHRTARVEAALAALALAGGALTLMRPPAFSPPWIGPWVTLAGALVALSGSLGPATKPKVETPPRS